ncbi:MAG: ester cyclase [Parachlamydia sp.]|nr:ester cyclase [Parachlamydia sp.]
MNKLMYLLTLCALLFAGAAAATITVDKSIAKEEAERMVRTAKLFYAFWDTGDPTYAREALSPDFIDQTLPEGRPQGPEGPLFASQHFRKVVPDLRCSVEEILVVGDRVIARLTFTGHHLGPFMGQEPTGKRIEFRAIDIYRIQDGKITDNWHIEDNLSLFQQLGVVK